MAREHISKQVGGLDCIVKSVTNVLSRVVRHLWRLEYVSNYQIYSITMTVFVHFPLTYFNLSFKCLNSFAPLHRFVVQAQKYCLRNMHLFYKTRQTIRENKELSNPRI